MSPSGVLYLVLIRENKPGRLGWRCGHEPCLSYNICYLVMKCSDEVCDKMRDLGFRSEEVLSRIARNEALSVVKFFRWSNVVTYHRSRPFIFQERVIHLCSKFSLASYSEIVAVAFTLFGLDSWNSHV